MAFGERKRDAALSFTPAGANALVCVADGAGLWSPLQRLHERTRKRRSPYYCRIDAAAIAGIFCALLFLLMSPAAAPWTSKWISVDLFLAEHSKPMPGARREDALLVSVLRDGQVYFSTRRITRDELPGKIRDGLRAGAENRIYLAVDSRAKYLDVKTVLDRIRDAGVERVSFLTPPHR